LARLEQLRREHLAELEGFDGQGGSVPAAMGSKAN
jgi:hypothetical protein